MKKAIPQYIRLGFLFGLVIIAIAAGLPYRNVQLLQNSEYWTDHTMEVLKTADAVRIAVTDAESSQRGFLLTQNPTYLEPYYTARNEISQHLTSLAVLTADNTSQVKNLNKLRELTYQKFEELEATIILQNQLKHTEALELVATNRGDNLMRQIRDTLIDFEKAEKHLLEERVTDTRAHFQHTFYSFLLMTLLTFVLFSGLYFFIVRSFKVKRAAEISLTQHSNLLNSVVNNMSEGLFVIDTSGKTIIHNPVLTEIYGKDVAKFKPEDWQSHFNISAMDGSAFPIENFPAIKILKGEHHATAEMIIQPIDSITPKIIKVTARPIIGASGTIEGVVSITSDISEDKKVELRLRLATEQSEAANKAKSEFVANMSHEIRTPLNAILGISQLLQKTELAKAQKKYLDMIILSGKSLLNILNDILDFSKIEAGKMEVAPVQFRLNDVIQSLGTIMSMAAVKKDIELIIDIKDGAPTLLIGDSHRLLQILVNLVSNAIKFTEAGEVAVIVDYQNINDDQVTIFFRVKDTGIGMTQTQQERLFSAFTQADASVTRQFGGTGLGLIISRRLAELMGGHIELSSSSGIGSEFSLVLPFTRCDDVERRAFPRHSLKGFKLLVIDNNGSARNAIGNHVRTWRWTADLVASVDEGVELLRSTKSTNDKYDAVLLDWQITGNSGKDSLKAITSASVTNTPIVLMVNTYAQEKISMKELQEENLNPICLLLKPVISSTLFDALNELLSPQVKAVEVNSTSNSIYQPLEGLRILVVEDNEFNQIVARDLLHQVGAIVDIVGNGQKAVDVLRENEKNYDVILMVIQMPVMDGLTATRIIRQELKITTTIIATTAGVTEPERESCLTSGMNDLIAKPIEMEKMIATISKHTLTQKRLVKNQTATISPVIQKSDGIFDVTNLLKIGENNPEHLKKIVMLIENLVKNSETSFESAKNQFKEQNYKEVGKILHTLRGSLGVIGAKQFSENALALEKLIADNSDGSLLETTFDHVQIEFTKTLYAAKKWTGENSVTVQTIL